MLKKKGEKEKGFLSDKKMWLGVTTLIGTIVGAGILGIPYVVAQSGFLIGGVMILLLGLALMMLNLFTGEIVLGAEKQHQLTGYAEKYLGKWGKRTMAFSMIFTIYGALTAYLIGEGETLKAVFKAVFGPFFNVDQIIYSLIFFVVVFFIILKGVKAAGKAELILILLLFLIVALIGIFSFGQIDGENLKTLNIAKFFIPYGVIFFALMGSPAVPEMQEVMERNGKKMKKAIVIGSLAPIVLYLVFAVFVIGVIGLDNFEVLQPNERIATVALSIYSLPLLGTFANIMAVLAMFTSFLTLGIALVELYNYDYGLSRSKSLLLVFSVPLLITIFKLSTFIVVIGTAGAIAGGLEGIVIILMYWKAKKMRDREPEYSMGMHKFLGVTLMILFGLGVMYQIYSNFSF